MSGRYDDAACVHRMVQRQNGAIRERVADWIATEAVGRARALKSGGVEPTVDNHLKLDHDVSAASFDWHGYADQPDEVVVRSRRSIWAGLTTQLMPTPDLLPMVADP